MCVSLVTQLRFQEVSDLESVIEEEVGGGGCNGTKTRSSDSADNGRVFIPLKNFHWCKKKNNIFFFLKLNEL